MSKNSPTAIYLSTLVMYSEAVPFQFVRNVFNFLKNHRWQELKIHVRYYGLLYRFKPGETIHFNILSLDAPCWLTAGMAPAHRKPTSQIPSCSEHPPSLKTTTQSVPSAPAERPAVTAAHPRLGWKCQRMLQVTNTSPDCTTWGWNSLLIVYFIFPQHVTRYVSIWTH